MDKLVQEIQMHCYQFMLNNKFESVQINNETVYMYRDEYYKITFDHLNPIYIFLECALTYDDATLNIYEDVIMLDTNKGKEIVISILEEEILWCMKS